ncbi:MAG TPA: hypothetical protein VG841_09140 [Caulobacterales bacterium]|nr:hypothetical protein [Caulobacterales bacterium]
MTVQLDPDAQALLAQMRNLDAAIKTIEARLTQAGSDPNPDMVAAALAEPVKALGAAARDE